MDLTPKRGGGSHLVKMWTFVLYPMEPLAQGVGGSCMPSFSSVQFPSKHCRPLSIMVMVIFGIVKVWPILRTHSINCSI